MNRREALMAILCAPVGQVVQQQKENGSLTFSKGIASYPTALRIDLADKENGITFLEVTYNGKSKTFTAKEIWEALGEQARS